MQEPFDNSNFILPTISLGLLLYAMARRSKKAFFLFATTNLFAVLRITSQHQSPSVIKTDSCLTIVPVNNPYNWFNRLGRIRHKNFEQADVWGKSYERAIKPYDQIDFEYRKKFEEVRDRLVHLKLRLLTFQTFDPSVGGRCGEHASLTLIRVLAKFIQSNWTDTYPIQLAETVAKHENRGHEFVITYGLSEKRHLKTEEEMESYLAELAKNKDATLQDTWIKPGGICEKVSVLYEQRDKVKLLSFWESNPLKWYFNTHQYAYFKVSEDYSQYIQIPADLPMELVAILTRMRDELETEILKSVQPENTLNEAKNSSLKIY